MSITKLSTHAVPEARMPRTYLMDSVGKLNRMAAEVDEYTDATLYCERPNQVSTS